MNTITKWTARLVLALLVWAPAAAGERPLAVIEINSLQDRMSDVESIPGLAPLLSRFGEQGLRVRILPGTESGSLIQVERLRLEQPSGPEWIRGRIDSQATAAFLREFHNLPAAIYAGFLDHVESIEFTRDIRNGALLAGGSVALKQGSLPTEADRFLNTAPASPPVLPAPLPDGVVLGSAFHTAPAAGYACLEQMAASDPKGPLRNLGFWTGEFEERSGRNVEADLIRSLGERGWFFLLEGDAAHTLNGVMILETLDDAAAEAVVRDLLVWWSDHARGRSLGLFSPRLEGSHLKIRTLFGEITGPAFEVRNGFLFLATSPEALLKGRKLFRTRKQWQPTVPAVPAAGQFAHEAVRVSGRELADWIEMLESPGEFGELLHGLDSIDLDVWYVDDSIRVSGRAQFN